MNRKFKLKQRWSTIPPISTNEQVTEHTHTHTHTRTTYGVTSLGLGLVKLVCNGIDQNIGN